jgi:DNA-binding MarR family transcriptional regulator
MKLGTCRDWISKSSRSGECMSVQQADSTDSPIQLSASDAREVARLLELLLKKDFRPSADNSLLGHSSQEAQERSLLVAKARAVFSERKRRSQYFSPVMFGEPGWDMLLALYITDFAGGRLSTGKLINWIGEPHTTALRWIDYLEKERLISREPDPRDRRTVLVDITEKARKKLDDYFASLALPWSG